MFPAEEIPETIGTYRILQRLVSNGPAEVYLARNEGPLGYARECELKLLPDTSDGTTGFAEELAREAAICARLNHPAVVRVYDFFEHEGKLALALEHVEGISLADLVQSLTDQRQRLGDAAVYYIGARLAGALGDAHAAVDEQGKPAAIVHRNLKPDNVLISVDGEVRLTGFGIGKIVGRTVDTAIGKVKGTPGFMAPEQARGEPVTTKADVYGLGVLMWSLLAGKRPPTDGTWPRRISGIRTDLPREVAAVIDAALDHFPGTRKISAREIEQWLTKSANLAKGRAELKDRVAAVRGESGAKEDAPAPDRPSRPQMKSRPTGVIPAPANPFQGVRFGPVPEGGVAPRAARRTPESKYPKPAEPQRTGTALSRVVAALPPPPPIEGAPPPPAAPRFGAPPPTAAEPPPAAPRFGAPSAEEIAIEPDEDEALAEPAPASTGPRGGPVVPKPSILPSPTTRLAALASLPRSSLLGMKAPQTLDDPPAEAVAPAPQPAAPSLPAPVAPGAPGRRPSSVVGTAAFVSAITATVIVAVALYAFVGRDRGNGPKVSSSAASASAAPVAPPVTAAPIAPVADAAPPSSSGPNPADLPYGFGYLTVVTPAGANVYLSGKIAGPANTPLKVRCGRWFVRLAAPPESRYPEWVSQGETVVVACQQVTRLDMSAPK